MSDSIEEYAHKLQVALTGLARGGSELFVKHGDGARADIAFCVDRINRRQDQQFNLLKKEMRLRKISEEVLATQAATLEEARAIIRGFMGCSELDVVGPLQKTPETLALEERAMAFLIRTRKETTNARAREIIAKALIDVDPFVSGHHEIHVEMFLKRVDPLIADLASNGLAIVPVAEAKRGKALPRIVNDESRWLRQLTECAHGIAGAEKDSR